MSCDMRTETILFMFPQTHAACCTAYKPLYGCCQGYEWWGQWMGLNTCVLCVQCLLSGESHMYLVYLLLPHCCLVCYTMVYGTNFVIAVLSTIQCLYIKWLLQCWCMKEYVWFYHDLCKYVKQWEGPWTELQHDKNFHKIKLWWKLISKMDLRTMF